MTRDENAVCIFWCGAYAAKNTKKKSLMQQGMQYSRVTCLSSHITHLHGGGGGGGDGSHLYMRVFLSFAVRKEKCSSAPHVMSLFKCGARILSATSP
jgi:hypothetical protein